MKSTSILIILFAAVTRAPCQKVLSWRTSNPVIRSPTPGEGPAKLQFLGDRSIDDLHEKDKELVRLQQNPDVGLTHSRREVGLGVIRTVGGVLAATRTSHPALAADEEWGTGPEGLKFKDLEKGDRLKYVVAGDMVKVNYELKLVDTGTTVENVQDYAFQLNSNQVFEGFNMAMIGGSTMPRLTVGGKRKVIVPARLAFGRKGRGCQGQDSYEKAMAKGYTYCAIPPKSNLELTISLLDITKTFRTDKAAVDETNSGFNLHCVTIAIFFLSCSLVGMYAKLMGRRSINQHVLLG